MIMHRHLIFCTMPIVLLAASSASANDFRRMFPHEVAALLLNEGLAIESYQKLDHQGHGGTSATVRIGKGSTRTNTLSFSVGGEAMNVKRVMLTLTIQQPEMETQAFSRMEFVSSILAKRATGAPLPKSIRRAVLVGMDLREAHNGFTFSVLRAEHSAGHEYKVALMIE